MRNQRGTQLRQAVSEAHSQEEIESSGVTVCDCCGSVEYRVYLFGPDRYAWLLCPECVGHRERGGDQAERQGAGVE